MRHFAPRLFKKGQIYHSNIFKGLGTCISMSVGPIKLFQEVKGVLIMNFLYFVQVALLAFPFSKTPINLHPWECSDKGILPSPGSQCGSACVLPRGLQVEQILSVRRVSIFPIKGVWETHLAGCLCLGPLKADCGASSKEPTCQWRKHKRCRFDPWVKKIPWRMAWQPTWVLSPGESHAQRSLMGYSPQGRRKSDMTEGTYYTSSTSWLYKRNCLPWEWFLIQTGGPVGS